MTRSFFDTRITKLRDKLHGRLRSQLRLKMSARVKDMQLCLEQKHNSCRMTPTSGNDWQILPLLPLPRADRRPPVLERLFQLLHFLPCTLSRRFQKVIKIGFESCAN